MRSISRTMSPKRRAGFLEGIHCFREGSRPHVIFQSRSIGHIDRAAYQLLEKNLDSAVFEQRPDDLLVDLHHDIDVAFGARVATSDRSKNRGMQHAAQPELWLVRAQLSDHIVDRGCSGHNPS